MSCGTRTEEEDEGDEWVEEQARGDIRMVELRSAPNPSLVYRIFTLYMVVQKNVG